jgi:hypothetical protein
MPPTARTFFVVSTPKGEDELMCFHDQVSRIVNRDGHALITLIDGAEIHLQTFTVRDAILKLFVPVYGVPDSGVGSKNDVSRLN